MPDPSPLTHPERIGSYRVLRVIGEGGMGVVYEAQQEEPVRRRVAVKMMKLGMDTVEVMRRFDAERQALAVMDHPGIAKVFDAGATERGRPYFVMELVRGIRLDKYCDEEKLTTRQRVGLFIEVCEAVQHAHQKGVIHRDLKPGNILVTEVGGRPACRVIDFGVARAADHGGGEGTQLTRDGHAVGTPAYMSPEQILGEAAAVDTRSDIFAMGVILYELLSGALPRERRIYGSAALLGALLEDPPTPGRRFGSLGETQRTVARLRGTDPRSLQRQLKGDLEWIVMKAMAGERERRYETANGLAMDLRRYMQDEPVLARPPSRTYRLGKFTRRNSRLVAVSAAALVAMIAGLVGTTMGFVEVRHERDRTAAVNDYLVREILSAPNPSVEGSEVRVVEVLDRAAAAVGETFAGRPDLEADIRVTLSRTYRGLGQYDRAEEHAVVAHRLRSELYGEGALATVEALDRIGRAKLGQDRFEEAIEILTAAAEGLEREAGPDDQRTLETLADLAAAYARSGRFDEAIALERDVLEAHRRVLGEEADLTSRSRVSLAATLLAIGELDEAEELYLGALSRLTEAYGDENTTAIGAMNGLSSVYLDLGDTEQAEGYARRSWEASKVVYGEDHPEAAIALNGLASALRQAQRYEEAEPVARQVAELYRKRLGEDHQWTMNAVHNVAATLARLGRIEEAEGIHLENLADRRRVLGERSGAAAQSLSGLGIVYSNSERYREAIDAYTEALEVYRSVFGEGHPEVATTLSNLAVAYRGAEDDPRAAETLRELLELDRDALGPTHRWVLMDYRDLIRALVTFDPTAATAMAQERLEHTEGGLQPSDPANLESLTLLGMTLERQGRFEEAEPPLLDAFRGLTSLDGENDRLRDATESLVRLYERWGRQDEARRYRVMLAAQESGVP